MERPSIEGMTTEQIIYMAKLEGIIEGAFRAIEGKKNLGGRPPKEKPEEKEEKSDDTVEDTTTSGNVKKIRNALEDRSAELLKNHG